MMSVLKLSTGELSFEASNSPPPKCVGRNGSAFMWRAYGHVGNINDINRSLWLKVMPVKDWNKWYENLPRDTKGKLHDIVSY